MKTRLVFRFLFLFSALSVFHLSGYAQYFQQDVRYKITVTLNDRNHSLSGFESFDYVNHAPTALPEIYMHLWPNAYKNRKTALFRQFLKDGNTKAYFCSPQDMGFIDSLRFEVDGKEVACIPDPVHIDICKLVLPRPLAPGEKVTVTSPFYVKLPSAKLSRLGNLGQAYAISQWYPKPAVYDAGGWHAMPYLNQGEFYSEFGSYEVSITLPANYVVGATGDLQNEEEIDWLNRKAMETDTIQTFGKNMDFPLSAAGWKTITYKQSNVHDFAWFADKRYHVLKGEVELPHTREKVTTWAFFTNSEPQLWKKSILYLNRALYHYSQWNGDYPYKNCSVVDGTIAAGGGMEYPNIAVIGKSGNDFILEDVITHEAGHNWFYGILGINERDHGWMDEGVNTSNEIRYLVKFYSADTVKMKNVLGNAGFFGKLTGLSRLNSEDFAYLEYLYSARRHVEQPIELPSVKFTPSNYGTIMYAKTGLGFCYLRDYLGDSLYDACMQEYVMRWKFRHPLPDDMHRVFAAVTGKNLDWFFKDFIGTNSRIDYRITSFQRIYGNSFINPISKGYALRIRNRGNIISPFSVSTLRDNRVLSTRWYEGFAGTDTIHVSCENCDDVRIDAARHMPDVNRKNNTSHTHGVLKTVEQLSFPFLVRIENPDRTQVFWTPAIGWNNYDKTMLGLALHDISFLQKKLEFAAAPLYSFGTGQLAGSGLVNYSMYPDGNFFHKIIIGGKVARFAFNEIGNYYKNDSPHFIRLHYQKADGQITAVFKNKNATSSWLNQVSFRDINIWEEQVSYIKMDSLYVPQKYLAYRYHTMLTLSMANNRPVDPFRANLRIEQGKKYVKPSLEFVYRYSYQIPNRGVEVRLFSEGFLLNIDRVNSVYITGAGKGFTGSQDYLYDNNYFGRSDVDGIWSRQFYNQSGDFKVYSPIGRNDLWMASLNIKAHFPLKIPARAYLDVAIFDGSRRPYEDYKGLTYDAGLSLCLVKDIMEVYFPVFQSTDLKRYFEVNDIGFMDKIRFVFNLNAFSPIKLRDSLLSF